MFPSDFKELFSVFNNRKVKYLLVGGYVRLASCAAACNQRLGSAGQPGCRKCRALYAALAEFGAPLEEIKAADFMEPDMFFRMGTPPANGGHSPGHQRCRF
jgi:hypothetical protein